MAQIYVNQGNIADAERVITQARKNQSPKSLKFWDAYRQISFLANKPQDALYASQQLLKDKNK